MATCSIEGCDNKVHSHKLCQKHYLKWKKYGDPLHKHFNLLAKNHRKEHIIWSGMKQRCNNENSVEYENYGGRGIKVCERWNSSDGFANFYKDMGSCPDNHTLDRIDVNKGYSPENCRWATWSIQAANKNRVGKTSKYLGVSKLGEKWKAELIVNRKRYYSIHKTEDEAYSARLDMEREHLGYRVSDIIKENKMKDF